MKEIQEVQREILKHGIETRVAGSVLVFQLQDKEIKVETGSVQSDQKNALCIPLSYFKHAPEKVCALLLSRFGLNMRVFARKCEVRQVDKTTATAFQDRYHLIGATGSAYQRGLFYEGQLVALATFSKGRKMNRLAAHERSYELIRFCCKSGYTVSGGLSKLVKHFCREKQAGDVMSYVDKYLSEGASFQRAGFKVAGETGVQRWFVEKEGAGRVVASPNDAVPGGWEETEGPGSVKLIFRCQKPEYL